MKFSPRAVIFAAVGVGPLLLASGCGGSTPTGASATIANIQPTSFVEVPPATTTTTTTTIPQGDLPAGTRSPSQQTYTIQGGDSLGKIAALYDITLEQLVNYNQFPDGAGQLILPGDTIKIPPDALVPGTATDTGGDTGTDTGTDSGTDSGDDGDDGDTGVGCTHTIVAGENPSKVANQYDITTEELFAANPGGVMDNFLIGDTLNIPASGTCD
jgi:LysM repeat protein